MKRTTIVIVVLVACVVAAILIGSAARARLIRSPMYCLVQVRTAFVTHDTVRFNEYVDLDRAADGLASQLREPAHDSLELTSAGDGWRAGFRNACAGLTQSELAQILRHQALRLVSGTAGEPDSGGPGAAAAGRLLESVLRQSTKGRIEFRGISYTRTDANTAVLVIALFSRRSAKSLALNLRLRNAGSHWQIAEVTNIQEYLSELGDTE